MTDHEFDREVGPEALRVGPLAMLAWLVDGPVITTNFDHVLEETFTAVHQPFAETVIGPQPDRIIAAFHQNRRTLFKIHGDGRDRTLRTFTISEYQQTYPAEGSAPSISSLAWVMFTNRPLLFLGCSLERDRTVNVLEELHRRIPGLRHFAILAAPYSDARLVGRQKALGECGVTPIWFRPEDVGRIEFLLAELLDRVPTRPLASASARTRRPAEPKPVTPVLSALLAGRHLQKGKADPVLKRVARRIAGGHATFFLGAWAHLRQSVLGNAFNDKLRQDFDAPRPQYHRCDVATWVRNRRGEDAVMDVVRTLLSPSKVPPTLVHRLIALLPGSLRLVGRDQASHQLVLTTNYDATMEQALEEAGEAFHLLYYVRAGTHEGLFAYRAPDGREAIIEQPEKFVRFREPGTVVVKLNGGLAYGPDIPKGQRMIPESVLIAPGDFAHLAGRLGRPLPHVLRAMLAEPSLLFLGHGLREPDVHELIRLTSSEGPKRESWAVQPEPPQDLRRLWESAGLDLIGADLEEFAVAVIDKICRTLDIGPAGPGA